MRATEVRTCEIAPDKLPEGAVLHDFLTWQVQELKIDVRVIDIKRARYRLPDGSYIIASAPREFAGSHFGPELRAYIVNLSQNGRMTQNKIFEHIQGLGIQISEGQIDNILSNATDELEHEYNEVHEAALKTAQFIQSDMTGGRHKGKNVHALVLNNAHFTIFVTLDSKSRITLFKALQGARPGYLFNEASIDYINFKVKAGTKELKNTLLLAKMCMGISCATQAEWYAALEERRVVRISRAKSLLKNLEEAALMGHLVEGMLSKNLVLVSDGAPEFAFLLLYQLCWIHAVRIFEKLIASSPAETQELDLFLDDVWSFYRACKSYCNQHRDQQSLESKQDLIAQFDQIFKYRTIKWQLLKKTTDHFYKNKDKLLLALALPFVPLHNNASENDIRTVVIRRKISGGTRSDKGRKSCDVFASLYKTCKKQKISFWDFLKDRFTRTHQISYLPDLIRAQAPAPPVF